MKLKGQVVLITGAERGIGRQIADCCAGEGADVALLGLDGDALAAAAETVRAAGRQGLPLVADVSREEQVAEAVRRVQRHFGRIDVLVNNAAIVGPTAPVHEIDRAEWEQTLNVNLTGAFLCCRAALPDMIARRRGRIINIASIAGKQAYPLRSPYAVSKWGLIGLTLTLAGEVGEHNVQVNAICPGPVQGERMRAVIENRAATLERPVAEIEAEYVGRTALRRLVREEDVAAMVVFLAGAGGDNITGQALDVTAGYGL